MSDKISIREFIDTQIHPLWNEYYNDDIDCKIHVKKELFENDVGNDGYEIIRPSLIKEDDPVDEETNQGTESNETTNNDEEEEDIAPYETTIIEPPEIVIETHLFTYNVLNANNNGNIDVLNENDIFNDNDNDNGNDYYVIIRCFDNSELLREIKENKGNYPDGIDINSIEILRDNWHEGGSRYFHGEEHTWYCNYYNSIE